MNKNDRFFSEFDHNSSFFKMAEDFAKRSILCNTGC